jgi:hypothetical protein
MQRLPQDAEILPVCSGLRRLDRDRRRACEAALCKHGRGQADQSPDPGAIVQHGRRGDLPHHLAARTMVLGNTERLSQLFIVEAAQAGRDGGDAEPVPGAGRMVIGDSRVQRNAGAPGDFIPNDQRRQRFRPAEVGPRLRERRQRRHHGDADVALGRTVPIMAVEVVDLRRAGIGGTRYAGAPAVEEHTSRIPWFGGAIEKHGGVTRDAPCVHRTGGYGDATVSSRR